jgi:hypothetical protein
MIDSYKFGSITIDGKNYRKDVIVYKDTVKEWWRTAGHNVSVDDLKDILSDDVEIFVMGNGASGCCAFPDETLNYLKGKGIEVIVQKTGEAYKTYNELTKEGKNVVGGFHLTC